MEKPSTADIAKGWTDCSQLRKEFTAENIYLDRLEEFIHLSDTAKLALQGREEGIFYGNKKKIKSVQKKKKNQSLIHDKGHTLGEILGFVMINTAQPKCNKLQTSCFRLGLIQYASVQ